MKRFKMVVGLCLIISSGLFYLIFYLIYPHDSHHITLYALGKFCFVPIEVLLVTMVIHQLLDWREKRARLEKLKMVIGAFFSEIGTKLLAYLSDFDPQLDEIRNNLIVTDDWSEDQFSNVSKRLKNYDYGIEIQKVDLENSRDFLLGKRDFLLRLLENPILLENESFTDLLRAVFHLTEELDYREDIKQLPDTDYKHLIGDVERAYTLLVHEWLNYMKYMKDNYSHLFSLAMRTNPFDQEASPIVSGMKNEE